MFERNAEGQIIRPKAKKAALLCLAAAILGAGAYHLRGLHRLGQLDSAIVTVRIMIDAESKFSQAHPAKGFTCDWSELTATDTERDGRLGPSTNGHREGYSFQLLGCSNGLPNHSYRILAIPEAGNGGEVCADESGVLKIDQGENPPICPRP